MKSLFGSTTCILCGAPAQRAPHAHGGWAYWCTARCPHYCVPESLYFLLQLDNVFPRELKQRIVDYLLSLGPMERDCHELTKEEVNLATGGRIR